MEEKCQNKQIMVSFSYYFDCKFIWKRCASHSNNQQCGEKRIGCLKIALKLCNPVKLCNVIGGNM